MERHKHSPYIGQLVTPQAGNRVRGDIPWAADNGCFNGLDEHAFLTMLAKLPMGGLFICVPDVVADHAATLSNWRAWADDVAVFAPPAFVLQDGCDSIPCDAGAVFVGGSTKFKLGADARRLVGTAKSRGLWVHMGRVNTRRRVLYAAALGCDSIDGTACSMFPDVFVPKMLRWSEAADRQGAMFA